MYWACFQRNKADGSLACSLWHLFEFMRCPRLISTRSRHWLEEFYLEGSQDQYRGRKGKKIRLGRRSEVLIQFFKDFFWCEPFFKVLIEFVFNIASVSCFDFLGPKACGILVRWPGFEPTPLALEGKILTTGPQWKSLIQFQGRPYLTPTESSEVTIAHQSGLKLWQGGLYLYILTLTSAYMPDASMPLIPLLEATVLSWG